MIRDPGEPLSGASLSGRAVLVGLTIFVAIGLAVTVGMWLALRGPADKAAITAAEEQGRDHGAQAQADSCIDEVLRRAQLCSGQPKCTVKEQAFLNACLRAAPPPPELCATIPNKLHYQDSAQWRAAFCADHDRENDASCAQIVRVIQRSCE